MARKPRLSHFRFYPADFRNDPHVACMTPEARGVYVLLLCAAWEAPEPGMLPGNDTALMSLGGVGPETWTRVKVAVSRCFNTDDGHWIQKRVRAEYAAQQAAVERYRVSGKAGAKARWDKRKDGDANAIAMRFDGGSQGSKVHQVHSEAKKKNTSQRDLYREHPLFAEFYAAYPRRIERRDAAKAFNKALIRKPDWEATDLVEAARSYDFESRVSDPKFIPYPASWLNGDRFLEQEEGYAETNQAPRRKS